MSGGLLTDLYEVTMAASYLRRGMTGPATFSLFVRDLPPGRGFLISCGLADCLPFLEDYRLTPDDLDYLATEQRFDDTALRALERLRFTGDVRAVPEGRVVFAGEPLLEVTAPIAEAQLVETVLLNHISFQTTLATKAERCVRAAGGAQVVDFAFRRTQGIDAAFAVARASYIAGFAGTSNVEAARRYGIPATGTMAHSYIEAFPDENAAFTAFTADFPDRTTLLVDTYDTIGGVEAAIRAARRAGQAHLAGIRLDSGDLGALAVQARHLLDQEGMTSTRIVASGGLDEYRIAELTAAGAPIDVYGVGTRMGVSADAPYVDSAYKLVAYGDRPVMKLSAKKATAPGAKQVYRGPSGDLVTLLDEPAPADMEPLLVPVMESGRRIAPTEPLQAARDRRAADVAALPHQVTRFHSPETVDVALSEDLQRCRDRLRAELTARTSDARRSRRGDAS
ncbi:nicotinate phosphoribosyltransferase [Actinomadura meyerae]|jgi:nicotinate phosphoribosyltransferase|uniref:Nicotinate phosphoribosyltransferase n=1 Tax=Actinomadura meyerae TaxID=240840 RepID=A0A239HH27_9ACTN|nr:nicotinate phosphoribosyltransferase [Actinomadura meyerae]SNS80451.1 nicotinate phosphoribosyltransferase [Actinomadura meyerae]